MPILTELPQAIDAANPSVERPSGLAIAESLDVSARIQAILEVRKRETPFYAYFPDQLERNIRAFDVFHRHSIRTLFALKASSYRPLVRRLIENGFGFDVASPQELDHVLALGARPSDISYSSPSKKEVDIVHASNRGVRWFVFDSESEIRKILRCAENPVLFGRLEMTDDGAVFPLSNKYGMTEDYAGDMMRLCAERGWPLRGLTFHVGSQNTTTRAWEHALEKAERCLALAKSLGLRMDYLNLGGGMPAPYTADVPDLAEFNKSLVSLCSRIEARFPEIQMIVEPGRAIAANTAALVAEVIDIKPYKNPPVAIVDTGVYNGILEGMPHFHFTFPLKTAHAPGSKTATFTIGGFSCDGTDIVRDHVELPISLDVGDRIAFCCMGAYAKAYELFHMVPFPSVVEYPPNAPAEGLRERQYPRSSRRQQ
jgi:ornithine decarboxylase